MKIDYKYRLEGKASASRYIRGCQIDGAQVHRQEPWRADAGHGQSGKQSRGLLRRHTTGSDVYVLNKVATTRGIRESEPGLYKLLLFHMLLRRTIHCWSCLDEDEVRMRVIQITKQALGEEHPATRLAENAGDFIKHLAYPDVIWKPEDEEVA